MAKAAVKGRAHGTDLGDDEELPPHDDAADADEASERQHDGGGVTIDLSKLPDARKAKKGGDERGDGEADDAPGGLELQAEEADEGLRIRRREERRQRKEERVRRERELERRLEGAESTIAQMAAERERAGVEGAREQVAKIDGEMERLRRAYAAAKELKEKAFRDRDNPESARTIVEADEAIISARESFSSLENQRNQIIFTAQEVAKRPKPSPDLKRHAQAFMDDHEWYRPDGRDEDSRAVLALDKQMAEEGWNPNLPRYWDELRERVEDELPHRFKDDRGGDRDRDQERERTRERPRERDRDRDVERPAPRRQTTGGSGREGGGEGGGNTFYLSAARVTALKEAGMWADPAKRAKMIRTYKQRDEQERRQKQRG